MRVTLSGDKSFGILTHAIRVRWIGTRDTRAPIGLGDEYGCYYYPSLRTRLDLRMNPLGSAGVAIFCDGS